MPYLTIQHLVREKLIRVFFSNATLEEPREEDENPCCIMAINTFVMGVLIRVTQEEVSTTFDK